MNVFIFPKRVGGGLLKAIVAGGGKQLSVTTKELDCASLVLISKELHPLVERDHFPNSRELPAILRCSPLAWPLGVKGRNIFFALRDSKDGCPNIGQLIMNGEGWFVDLPCCGRVTVVKVRNVLRLLGLDFKEYLPAERVERIRKLMDLLRFFCSVRPKE